MTPAGRRTTRPSGRHRAVVASPTSRRRAELGALLTSLDLGAIPLASVREVSALLAESPPALAVLQGFPVDDALLGLCRAVRDSPTRLVVLGSSQELIDRIIVLELGADEYLCEPADDRLVLSRLKAVLRRDPGHSEAPAPPAAEAAWRVDTLTRAAVGPGDVRVPLTAAELSLFDLFLRRRGAVVNEDVARAALGVRGGPAFRNAVSRLRRKLGSAARGTNPIRSFQGIGYLYED